MIKYRIAGLALVPVLALMVLFAACGGGGDKTIKTGDGGEVKISDDLPDDFPDSFPIYGGADFKGSVTGENEGVSGTVATWETGDDLSDVSDFYKDKLGSGDWKLQASGSTGGGAWYGATSSDEKKAAYVYLSEANGKTTILATVGDNDNAFGDGSSSGDDGSSSSDEDTPTSDNGSSDEEPPPAELPEEQDLPDDFPTDRVPLPDDIRVTSSSSLTSGGTTTHFVEFYSKKSADDLGDFFKTELEGKGWTQALTSNSDGDIYASYTDPSDTTSATGVTIIISKSDVEGYQVVNVSVTGI